MNKVIFTIFCLSFLVFATSSSAENHEYTVSFGLILKNDAGEPIGFKPTQRIPITQTEQPSLYGLVVTSSSETPFVLGAVHVFPSLKNTQQSKIMSKPMNVVTRGAIFFQTSKEDNVGKYEIEIYIDNKLNETIEYRLVNDPMISEK